MSVAQGLCPESGLSVGIAGAGVLGRLLAWHLSRAGHAVTVFDPAPGPEAPLTGRLDPPQRAHAAGFTAAGMLSPLAELDQAEPEVAMLGWRSLGLWKQVAQALGGCRGHGKFFRQAGSLLLAHGPDGGAARRVLARLERASHVLTGLPAPQLLDPATLAGLEPGLLPDLCAWLLPQEGQLMPREMLEALTLQARDVTWRWSTPVSDVALGLIRRQGASTPDRFDLVFDVRGLGAKPDLPLRGVRGEVVWLYAPAASLSRPVRLMHPRHRVYLVPRPGHLFVVGASEVESEDRSPVSLKTAVELMAAAQSVLPSLAEARIVHMEANLRPALPDNGPLLQVEPGRVRINGLFRHGWLLAPALVNDALHQLGLCPLTFNADVCEDHAPTH